MPIAFLLLKHARLLLINFPILLVPSLFSLFLSPFSSLEATLKETETLEEILALLLSVKKIDKKDKAYTDALERLDREEDMSEEEEKIIIYKKFSNDNNQSCLYDYSLENSFILQN